MIWTLSEEYHFYGISREVIEGRINEREQHSTVRASDEKRFIR